MKYLSCILLLVLLSCNNGDGYLNHKLSFSPAGVCSSNEIDIQMTANIAGERYSFNYCLDDGFDGKNYTLTRNGDSLLLHFNRRNPAVSYALTLDIDAYPAYRYLVLDGKVVDLGNP